MQHATALKSYYFFSLTRTSVIVLGLVQEPGRSIGATQAETQFMQDDYSVLGLSTIRRNRGISLEQISHSTKISMRSLQAIEHGDFAKLPGGIYNTSYIRQYARAIDYDEGEILAFYYQAIRTPAQQARSAGMGKGLLGGYHPASLAGH
jgi:helix-turn-helix protein